jgi:dTDP-4-amino-4,6-dideoxygalactose transaminase
MSQLANHVPAVLGGAKAFPEGVPFVRPSVPEADPLVDDLRRILDSGMLTNGPYVRQLEEGCAEYLGVRHCIAVASCTAGLMLVLRATEVTGDVVLPSFTFAATAHAVAWNGLRITFADVDPYTLTLSPDAAERVWGIRTSAILCTHIFGTPCDAVGLGNLAKRNGVRLFFDAAHAFGSLHAGTPVGRFGDAEVFSLSPTKVLIAGEGGIIATNDDLIAHRVRTGRDYGNPGDYDCVFVGLNARMSEIHAATALHSLKGLDERIERRNALADLYRGALEGVPGIRFPVVRLGDRSSYKDYTVLVGEDEFGLSAEALAEALRADGVDTRRYYSPPVHEMLAYDRQAHTVGRLPVTESVARCVLTLPLWSDMPETVLFRVAELVDRLGRLARRGKIPHRSAQKIRQTFHD